jgi:hypothetical protein
VNVSPPVAWRDVPVGAVVLDDGTPRTVLHKAPSLGAHGLRTVLLEGRTPFVINDGAEVRMVALDDADALATLARAGLDPIIIERTEGD